MQAWWEELRQQMPVANRWAYFDHAAVAPLSAPAVEAIRAWATDVSENGDANWGDWRKEVERVRKNAAEFLGANQDEVALGHNTTEGVNLVAEGFPWRAGDNVVTPTGEFPTNLYPWLNLADRDVETRQVPTDSERVNLDAIAAACDDRTKIIAVSWVGYATGWRNDLAALAELAHDRGAYLFVDAIQGLGVLPLDVRETKIDFLAADGHKWLLGPEGASVFYMRRDHLDLLRPLGLGWNSVKQAGNFSDPSLNLRETAARYEGGSYNYAGIMGFGASLKLLSGYGVEAVSQRLLEVTDRLCTALEGRGVRIVSSRNHEHWSGIISFVSPDGIPPRKIQQICRAQGVILNCRGGFLRASPHVYTNDEDIERLLSALESAN